MLIVGSPQPTAVPVAQQGPGRWCRSLLLLVARARQLGQAGGGGRRRVGRQRDARLVCHRVQGKGRLACACGRGRDAADCTAEASGHAEQVCLSTTQACRALLQRLPGLRRTQQRRRHSRQAPGLTVARIWAARNCGREVACMPGASVGYVRNNSCLLHTLLTVHIEGLDSGLLHTFTICVTPSRPAARTPDRRPGLRGRGTHSWGRCSARCRSRCCSRHPLFCTCASEQGTVGRQSACNAVHAYAACKTRHRHRWRASTQQLHIASSAHVPSTQVVSAGLGSAHFFWSDQAVMF